MGAGPARSLRMPLGRTAASAGRAHGRCAARIGLMVALLAPSSFAEIDEPRKAAARELAHQGTAALESGNHATAEELFRRAHELVPAPTLSLRRARALVQLGRLVEAAEVYRRTVQAPLGPEAPRVFGEAVRDAEAELAELEPTIPRLHIVLDAPASVASSAELRLDGQVIPAARRGIAMPVDPGPHQITASTPGGAHARRVVDLEVGSVRSVRLTLLAPPGSWTPSAAQPAGAAPPLGERGASQRTLAYVSFGAGAVGLGVGVTAGLLALQRHEAVEASCPGQVCVEGTAGADDLRSFRTLRTVSTIGYVVGALGAGGGLALLLSAPEPRSTALVPYLGVSAAGVRGRF